MRSSLLMKNRGWTGSALLLGTLALTAGSLVAWKHAAARKADAAAARQPEPIESVTLAVARERQYRPTTTSVGTILALNSITLRNELAGTVRQVALAPGQIVETGAVLVALDVSVEEAELQAEQAQADLAATSPRASRCCGRPKLRPRRRWTRPARRAMSHWRSSRA